MTSPAAESNPNRAAKAALRQRLIQARQRIPAQVWRQKSDRICQNLAQWDYLQRCRVILAYTSFRNEPDLSSLWQAPGYPYWGLPRCLERNNLAWHYWHPQGDWPLHKGSYGVLEPHPQSPQVDANLVDLILIPAVACDVRGFRLGYGAGYYDRLLSKSPWRQVPTVGIVFEYARLPQLPHDVWDRPLRGVCTESGLFLG